MNTPNAAPSSPSAEMSSEGPQLRPDYIRPWGIDPQLTPVLTSQEATEMVKSNPGVLNSYEAQMAFSADGERGYLDYLAKKVPKTKAVAIRIELPDDTGSQNTPETGQQQAAKKEEESPSVPPQPQPPHFPGAAERPGTALALVDDQRRWSKKWSDAAGDPLELPGNDDTGSQNTPETGQQQAAKKEEESPSVPPQPEVAPKPQEQPKAAARANKVDRPRRVRKLAQQIGGAALLGFRWLGRGFDGLTISADSLMSLSAQLINPSESFTGREIVDNDKWSLIGRSMPSAIAQPPMEAVSHAPSAAPETVQQPTDSSESASTPLTGEPKKAKRLMDAIDSMKARLNRPGKRPSESPESAAEGDGASRQPASTEQPTDASNHVQPEAPKLDAPDEDLFRSAAAWAATAENAQTDAERKNAKAQIDIINSELVQRDAQRRMESMMAAQTPAAPVPTRRMTAGEKAAVRIQRGREVIARSRASRMARNKDNATPSVQGEHGNQQVARV